MINIKSVDGVTDFGYYYVCIKPLLKGFECSNHFLEVKTGLDHKTIKQLLDGTLMRSDHKVIERICYCFSCKPSDFCFYVLPSETKKTD